MKVENWTVRMGDETGPPILTCSGVNRRQAFQRGSHVIGYGTTDEKAIENLKSKHAFNPERGKRND